MFTPALEVFSPETVSIKEFPNLRANNKHYGQITLNTEPRSYHPLTLFSLIQTYTSTEQDWMTWKGREMSVPNYC